MSLREKARSRVQKMRGQVQGVRGQAGVRGQRLGGGQLVEKVKTRANRVSSRIQERKPNLFPQIKEFSPGTRLRQILSPQQDLSGGSVTRLGTGISVEAEIPPKVRDNEHIAIEW
ncbi:hypothetical protein ES703_71308 [subsurface metagenome]